MVVIYSILHVVCNKWTIAILSLFFVYAFSNSYFNTIVFAEENMPFLLPFGNNQFSSNPLETKNVVVTPLSTSSCGSTSFSDSFPKRYTLSEGSTSPDGKWVNIFNGYGSSGSEKTQGTNNAFFLKPKAVTSPSQTEATLVRSSGSYCDFTVDFDMKTTKQLRQNSPPNTWEAGWFIFRYTDPWHFYWFLIRTDGSELGKKDCDTCTSTWEGQQFLKTPDNLVLKLNTWYHCKISVVGNHIKIWINGNLLIDYVDSTMSSQLSHGNIAMYSEDAYVHFDNFNLKPQ